MKIKVLIALVGSILKWDRLARGVGAERGASDCPLCRLNQAISCSGCPVRDNTGKDHCHSTPYYTARTALQLRKVMPTAANHKAAMAAAAEERDYLITLLPDADDIVWQ